jgi:hypothetical protein
MLSAYYTISCSLAMQPCPAALLCSLARQPIGPPPGIFRASEASKSQQIRARSAQKICALTFETCRSSDVYNYMIFYIIIGHRSNKIQSLLDINEFFSFFFKKTQKKIFVFFWRKKI